MISAIDDSNIAYYKFTHKSVNNTIFKNLIDELYEKIRLDNIKNYLIIFAMGKMPYR